MELFIKFAGDESGATSVEYALLLTCIAVALVGSFNAFSAAVNKLFNLPWP